MAGGTVTRVFTFQKKPRPCSYAYLPRPPKVVAPAAKAGLIGMSTGSETPSDLVFMPIKPAFAVRGDALAHGDC